MPLRKIKDLSRCLTRIDQERQQEYEEAYANARAARRGGEDGGGDSKVHGDMAQQVRGQAGESSQGGAGTDQSGQGDDTASLYPANARPVGADRGEYQSELEKKVAALEAEKAEREAQEARADETHLLEDSVKNYLAGTDIPSDKNEEASHELQSQLSTIARLSEGGDSYGDLFNWKEGGLSKPDGGERVGASLESRGSNLHGSLPEKNRDIVTLPQNADEIFKRNKNQVSSLIHSLISREIPSFSIDGKILNGPCDFAALLMPLRSPYFDSLGSRSDCLSVSCVERLILPRTKTTIVMPASHYENPSPHHFGYSTNNIGGYSFSR